MIRCRICGVQADGSGEHSMPVESDMWTCIRCNGGTRAGDVLGTICSPSHAAPGGQYEAKP